VIGSFNTLVNEALQKVLPLCCIGFYLPGKVILPNLDFKDRVYFSHAIFEEEVDFSGATFTKQIDFSRSDFMGEVKFDKSRFPSPKTRKILKTIKYP
jgi:Pentapeptide repeats (9 copies)